MINRTDLIIIKSVLFLQGGERLQPKPKIGRPTDNPKDKTLFIRLDRECSEVLDTYCDQKQVTKAEAARRGIKK